MTTTVRDMILRMLPTSRFPIWPPDVFAVTATLLERSSGYILDEFGGFVDKCRFFDPEHVKRQTELATNWAMYLDGLLFQEKDDASLIRDIQKPWNKLVRCTDRLDANWEQGDAASQKWLMACMDVLIIADEACAGWGFSNRDGHARLTTPELKAWHHRRERMNFFLWQQVRSFINRERKFNQGEQGEQELVQDDDGAILEVPTITLCCLVAISEACVQPKATLPKAGCSIRSLSHHLALLPPFTEVKSNWMWVTASIRDQPFRRNKVETPIESKTRNNEPLNLLLVPYPYHIEGDSFRAGGTVVNGKNTQPGMWDENKYNFFSVIPNWIKQVTPLAFAAFITDLVNEARKNAEVHGVVLPECALGHDLACNVARILAEDSNLEFFITGVCNDLTNEIAGTEEQTNKPSNKVLYFAFRNRESFMYSQDKHHRWMLEKNQIRRYHLGHALSTNTDWWEKIQIGRRECNFMEFRPGAILTALVCEDLARIDPVQRVIRSIGPNLVIALLMDGPQLKTRWSSRYATVLADDPGSAVLTLSSLGMIHRSVDPGQPFPNEIALWKDPHSADAIELKLPAGAHGLVLTLSTSEAEELSLDGRRDHHMAVKLFLSGVTSVYHPREPKWIHPT